MTREEKIKAVIDYCKSQGRDNYGQCKCPHDREEDFFCHKYSICSASEKTLDEWLKAVNPQSQEKVNHPAHYQGKMELNLNKDEAQLINCALTYYLQRGAISWYKNIYPKADLDSIFNQINIIEQVEE